MTSPKDTASSGPEDDDHPRQGEKSAMTSVGPVKATAVAEPATGPGAWQNRSERSLRRQLFAGDLFAVAVAWGLAMLLQSHLKPDKSVVVSFAAIVSVLLVIKWLGLYRSWVCSEYSRQAARIIGGHSGGRLSCSSPPAGWPSLRGPACRACRRGRDRRRRADDRAPLALQEMAEEPARRGALPANGHPGGHERGCHRHVADVLRRARAGLPGRWRRGQAGRRGTLARPSATGRH